MPTLFAIIFPAAKICLRCIRQRSRNSSYVKKIHTTTHLVSPTTYGTTTATAAVSSEPESAAAIHDQVGESNQPTTA